MKSDSKFMYDYENDSLFVSKKERSYESSVEVENMIFDLDKDKKIVGFEILGASKVLGVDKVFIKNVFEGKLDVVINEKFLQIKIQLKSKVRNSDKFAVYKADNFKPDALSPSKANFALAN